MKVTKTDGASLEVLSARVSSFCIDAHVTF
jgi:hypothetical protein